MRKLLLVACVCVGALVTADMSAVQDLLGRWQEYDGDQDGHLDQGEMAALLTAVINASGTQTDVHQGNPENLSDPDQLTPASLVAQFGTDGTVGAAAMTNAKLLIYGCLSLGDQVCELSLSNDTSLVVDHDEHDEHDDDHLHDEEGVHDEATHEAHAMHHDHMVDLHADMDPHAHDADSHEHEEEEGGEHHDEHDEEHDVEDDHDGHDDHDDDEHSEDDDEHSEDADELVPMKMWMLAGIFVMGVGGAAVPLAVRAVDSDRIARLVPLSNAVVAGVFLSVAVCHLLPHAVETGEEMAEDLNGFPAVFVVVLLGYLLIYFFEQVLFSTGPGVEPSVVDVACEIDTPPPSSVLPHHHHHHPAETHVCTSGHHHTSDHGVADGVRLAPGAVATKDHADSGGKGFVDEESGMGIGKECATVCVVTAEVQQSGSNESSKVCCDSPQCEDVSDDVCPPPVHRSEHVGNYVRALGVVMVATMFHASLAGMALGIADRTSTVRMMGYAILSHKVLVSFSIGLRCVQAEVSAMWCAILVGTFAACTPVFVAVGIATRQAVSTDSSTIINALSAGCFLYMGTSEVAKLSFLEAARPCGTRRMDLRERLKYCAALLVGVLAILCSVATEVALSDGEDHDH